MKKLWLYMDALLIAIGICIGINRLPAAHTVVAPPMPHTFGASGGVRPPIINPYWLTSTIVVDPLNVSGCASDGNNCTQSSCGSAGSNQGPCLTPEEFVIGRWACNGSPHGCPQLPQFTHLRFMSLSANPLFLYPACTSTTSGLLVTADLPTPAFSGTFSSATQWASTCTQGHVTAASAIGVPGAFLVDTDKSAEAWCNENSSSTTCNWGIPVSTPTSLPSTFQTPGLWTTATGGAGSIGSTDHYSEYTALTGVNIADVSPVVADWNTTAGSCVYLNRLNIFDPSGVGIDMVGWGPGVTGYEISSDRVIRLEGQPSNKDEGCVNCFVNGGLIGGRLSTGKFWHLNSGEISSNSTIVNATGTGIALDGYISLFSGGTFLQGVSMGLVAGSNLPAQLNVGAYSTLATLSPGYSGINNGVFFCEAAAEINVLGSGSFRYDSSHGGSAGIFGNSPPLTLNGQTTACSSSGSTTQTLTCGITITTTAMDTAVSTSAFGGRVLGQFGGTATANLQ